MGAWVTVYLVAASVLSFFEHPRVYGDVVVPGVLSLVVPGAASLVWYVCKHKGSSGNVLLWQVALATFGSAFILIVVILLLTAGVP